MTGRYIPYTGTGRKRDIRDDAAVMSLRAEHSHAYGKLSVYMRLPIEMSIVAAYWRMFDRRKWVLYMEQCLAGKVPQLACADVHIMKPDHVNSVLAEYGWK